MWCSGREIEGELIKTKMYSEVGERGELLFGRPGSSTFGIGYRFVIGVFCNKVEGSGFLKKGFFLLLF